MWQEVSHRPTFDLHTDDDLVEALFALGDLCYVLYILVDGQEIICNYARFSLRHEI